MYGKWSKKGFMFTVLCILLILFSSQSSSAYSLFASGPKIFNLTINNCQKSQIKERVLMDWLTQGFTLKTDSENQIVLEKAITDISGIFFMNLRTGQMPTVRLIFSLAQVSNNTFVSTHYLVVMNAGTAYENVEAGTNKEAHKKLERYLMHLKNEIDGTPIMEMEGAFATPPSEQPAKKRLSGITLGDRSGNGILVKSINEESVAATAGLKEGDVILEINARSVFEMGSNEIIQYIDKSVGAGRTVVISYERNKEIDLATLK